MDKLLDEIESYWSTRTEGYSEVNEKELKGMQKKAWLETLERGFFGKRSGKNEDSENNSVEKEVFEEEFSEKQHTDKYKDHLRILDIGTGPGFFPMILAEAGYHVTAIDYTPGMLEKAAENAAKFIGEKSRNIEFKRMDAQALEFEDESFDVIISRNLTWNLPSKTPFSLAISSSPYFSELFFFCIFFAIIDCLYDTLFFLCTSLR